MDKEAGEAGTEPLPDPKLSLWQFEVGKCDLRALEEEVRLCSPLSPLLRLPLSPIRGDWR